MTSSQGGLGFTRSSSTPPPPPSPSAALTPEALSWAAQQQKELNRSNSVPSLRVPVFKRLSGPQHVQILSSPSSSSSTSSLSSSSSSSSSASSTHSQPLAAFSRSRVKSLAKSPLCSLKRRIGRTKAPKPLPVCGVCPEWRGPHPPCPVCPMQDVCSDAFSHIMNFLSVPEMCAVTRVSSHFQTEVDHTLGHLQEASFLAQENSVKLELKFTNQMILSTMSRKCPRLRRVKSQTYVRLCREECHQLLRGCPRIRQIAPSIEFQAADIVSVGQQFPSLTEARVHFSTVKEGLAFGSVCPSIRSLLIDSENDQIGEIASALGSRLPRFKFLSVDLCARAVPRAGIHKIPQHLTLALSVVGNIQKEHCVTLTTCRANLVTLHLHHIPVGDFPVEGLRYLGRHMRSLKELDLPHTAVSMIRPIDNEISQVLSDSKAFPSLKRLYLKRYSSTFQSILRKTKSHVKLDRRSCS